MHISIDASVEAIVTFLGIEYTDRSDPDIVLIESRLSQ